MNINTGRLNFQQTPGDIQRDRLESRMYDNRNTRGPFFYPQSPFASMPTLRGLNGLRGLGGVTDVSALAAAMANGQIRPTYLQKMWTPGYTQVPEALPSQLCLDDSTSQQIAGLLGGSVISLPAQNLQGQVPNCNYIQLPDGSTMRAADLAQIAGITPNIYGKSTLCGYAQLLQMALPGSVAPGCDANPVEVQTPVYVAPPVTTPIYNTTPATSTSPANPGTANVPVKVPVFSLLNLSTGQDLSHGGTFRVGDAFQVAIVNAAPNAPVTVTAVHNGVSSTTVLGNTSAGGSFQSQGTMDDTTTGSWMESWQIPAGSGASGLATQVNFTVQGVPQSNPPATAIGNPSPPAGDDCTTVAGKIANLQHAGYSNADILAQIAANQPQFLTCAAAVALKPAAPADNTLLYVGLAAGALFLFMRGR